MRNEIPIAFDFSPISFSKKPTNLEKSYLNFQKLGRLDKKMYTNFQKITYKLFRFVDYSQLFADISVHPHDIR